MGKNVSRRTLRQRKRRLEDKLADLGPIIRGSVVTLRMPCTRKGCTKCESGEKHPNQYLSTSKQGKTHLRYIRKALRPSIQECVANYQEAKAILEDLSDVNADLLFGQKAKPRDTSRS